MKTISVVLAAVLGLFVFVGSAQATVLRVVVVQTDDSAAYMKEIQKIQAAMTRLGSKATIRVWHARYAGSDAGAVVASIEYADLAALAADDAKTRGDAEMQGLVKGLDKMRKIVSDSLYEELK